MKFIDELEERVPHMTIWGVTLHKKLVSRLVLLGVAALFLFCTILFDAIRFGFELESGIPIFLIGLVAGATLFSRISAVVWDEEHEAVSVARMDAIGFAVLIAYYGFDVMLRAVLLDLYQDADLFYVRGLIIAGVFGAVVGRIIWFMVEISRARDERTPS